MSLKPCSHCGCERTEENTRPADIKAHRNICAPCGRARNRKHTVNKTSKTCHRYKDTQAVAVCRLYPVSGSHKGRMNGNYRASHFKSNMPPWAVREDILLVYETAYELGHEVDHIIRRKGMDCSGLHVLDNLQILSPSAHKKKSSKDRLSL